jgi:hypothetical protein
MQIIKDMECVEVVYTSDQKKATMTFFSEELNEIRDVNFNLQVYKDGKWLDSPEKAAKVNDTLYEYLRLDFDSLGAAVGLRMDIYDYDTFNSLYPVDIVEKFTEEQNGEIFDTTIKEVVEDDYAIRIRYDIYGKTYESKMTHGKYLEQRHAWAADPQKKEKQYKKFEEKFGKPVSKKDELVGKRIMVEVKSAFGRALYGDIKKLKK